jgi:copper(I)-binding protein
VKKTFALLAVAALGLAACGDDDADGVSVSNAWARTSPMSASVGALYMNIESDADDQLLAVTVDPSVAARTEIHETVAADDMGTDMDEGDMDEGMDGDMGTDMDEGMDM